MFFSVVTGDSNGFFWDRETLMLFGWCRRGSTVLMATLGGRDFECSVSGCSGNENGLAES